jgi:hypothetical protein
METKSLALNQIKRCILHRAKLPVFLHNGAAYGEEGPMLQLDSLLVRLASLRATSLGLVPSEDSKSNYPSGLSLQQLETLAVETKGLDEALSAWPGTAALDEEWKCLPHRPPIAIPRPEETTTNSAQISALPSVDVEFSVDSSHQRYASYSHASVWNTCRAARVMVNSIRIRCLSRIPLLLHEHCSICSQEYGGHPATPAVTTLTSSEQEPDPQQQLEKCKETLRSVDDDLCASLPFFFHFSIITRKGFEQVTTEKRLIFSNARMVPKVAAFLAWPLAVAAISSSSSGYDSAAITVGGVQGQQLLRALKTVAESLQDSALGSIVEQEQQHHHRPKANSDST